MLINIGPDRRGHLPECDSKALIQFGQTIKQRTASPLITIKDFIADDDGQSWNYQTPEGTTRCNMIVIAEDLTDGESVKRFSIDINCYNNGRFLSIYQGCTIGHKQIIRLPEIRAANVRLRILESDGPVKLRSIELHHV